MVRFGLISALVIFGLLPAVSFAGAKKGSAVAIRFHAEGGREGGEFSKPITLLHSGKETYMQAIPMVSENDIISYHPFAAKDGSFGAYFKVDNHGTNLVTQTTLSKKGTCLLVFVNGRHVIDLYIDRSVTDGIVSIPKGLTVQEMQLFEQKFPRFGHEGEKPKKQSTAKAEAAGQ